MSRSTRSRIAFIAVLWASVVASTCFQDAIYADIPPPPINGDGKLSRAVENLDKGGFVKLKYTPAAERVSIVLPKQHVERVQRAGLMEFVDGTAVASSPTDGLAVLANSQVQAIAIGVALSLMLITAGIWLFRAKLSSITMIALALGLGLCVTGAGSLLLIASVWQSRSTPAAPALQKPEWPKRNTLGADVTVVDTGAVIEIIIPAHLQPSREPRWRGKEKEK